MSRRITSPPSKLEYITADAMALTDADLERVCFVLVQLALGRISLPAPARRLFAALARDAEDVLRYRGTTWAVTWEPLLAEIESGIHRSDGGTG